MPKNFTGEWMLLNFSDAILWKRFLSKSGEIINESASKGYYLTSDFAIKDHGYVQVPTGTLYYKHISNMLHVLMGERPAPSLYEEYSLMKRLDWIDEMAKESLVNITTLSRIEDKKDALNNYIQEYVSTRKAGSITYVPCKDGARSRIKDDCWNSRKYTIDVGGQPRVVSGVFPTWEIVILFLGDLFNDLYTVLCDLHGSDILKISFAEAMHLYGGKPCMHEFALRCEAGKRKPFYWFIVGGAEPSFVVETGSHPLKRQALEIRGVDTVSKLRGSIVVPLLHKTALTKLRQGPGCATILDGGLVTIQEFMEMTPNTRLNYTEAYVR